MKTDRELLGLAANGSVVRKRHGMNKSPEHRAWVHMKQRCTNPKKREYKHYGGRGIKVCDEWMHSFLAFFEHIGLRPSEKHSLDRIDVNGDYEPGNVRWATHQQQIENTTVVKLVTLDGRSQSISAWEREYGLHRGTVSRRVTSGWSIEMAIRTPPVKGQKLHQRVQRDYSTRTMDSHGRYQPEED